MSRTIRVLRWTLFGAWALAAAVASYVYQPTWDAVRAERVVRFEVLDERVLAAQRAVNIAERSADMAAHAAALSKLNALYDYGQALADITKQSDPESPQWPTPPWEK